jgi:hypothetical protein
MITPLRNKPSTGISIEDKASIRAITEEIAKWKTEE